MVLKNQSRSEKVILNGRMFQLLNLLLVDNVRSTTFKGLGVKGNGGQVKKILQHLGLWDTRSHDPPAREIPHIVEYVYDDAYSQILSRRRLYEPGAARRLLSPITKRKAYRTPIPKSLPESPILMP